MVVFHITIVIIIINRLLTKSLVDFNNISLSFYLAHHLFVPGNQNHRMKCVSDIKFDDNINTNL